MRPTLKWEIVSRLQANPMGLTPHEVKARIVDYTESSVQSEISRLLKAKKIHRRLGRLYAGGGA